MSLENLGWNPFFNRHFENIKDNTLSPGRVTSVRKNSFLISSGEAEFPATVSGKLRRMAVSPASFPATGDWVAFREKVITHLLPRRNALTRGASGNRDKKDAFPSEAQVIAANVDTVFIVSGLDRDYNLRRIERYLTLVYNSGCVPVVLLNKCDLHRESEIEKFKTEVADVAIGVPIHPISAEKGIGITELSNHLCTGGTVVLMGSSGVGKSTLVNRMVGDESRMTRPVSQRVGKGLHTTTSRDLIQLPGGGMIIDNPGLREIAFWDDEDGIGEAFPEVVELAAFCRFSDCSHQHEPGCRVQSAVRAGDLPPERLESYLKMKQELQYISERRHKSADRIEKEKWKAVAMRIKGMKKTKLS